MTWQPSVALANQIARFRGGQCANWLTQLPQLVATAVDRWSLRLAEPFPYPSLSFVAPATRADGSAVVLKIGPLLDELACESAALHVYAGRGAVRLLDADVESGALLLEQLEPGTAAIDLDDDDQATSAAIMVMRELHGWHWRLARQRPSDAAPETLAGKPPVPPESPDDLTFPTVADLYSGLAKLRPLFGGTTGPLPRGLVEQAERLAADLWASTPALVVLHGDLQHYNLLRDGHGWRAIDPKGVLGEPAYEVGAFLRNELLAAPDPPRRLARRVDRFAAELGLDRERVRGWGLAHAVLSAWWSVEDHLTADDCDEALRCAELLERLA